MNSNTVIIILEGHSGVEDKLGAELSEALGIPFLHFGRALGEEMRSNTPLGNELKSNTGANTKMPLRLMSSLILSRIPSVDFYGMILCTYPRSIQQLKNLIEVYEGKIKSVIGIQVGPSPWKNFQDYIAQNGLLIETAANYNIDHIATTILETK